MVQAVEPQPGVHRPGCLARLETVNPNRRNTLRTIVQARRLLAWAGLCACAGLGGCVASAGRIEYTRHAGHRIDPGDAANADVAFAFGLDGFGDQDEARVEVTVYEP
jgi:hypothetical protein